MLPADGRSADRKCSGQRSFQMEERHDPDRRARWPGVRRHRRGPGRGRRRDRGRPDRRTSARASTATRRSTSPAGRCCPGLFDCHTHVMLERHRPAAAIAPDAVLVPVLRGGSGTWPTTLGIGITTIRDAGGADLGIKQAVARRADPRPADADLDLMLSQTGGHGDGWMPSGRSRPVHRSSIPADRRGSSTGPTRCGARSASCAGWAPTSSRSRPRAASCRRATIPATPTSGRPSSRCSSRRRPPPGIFVMAHAQGADGIKNADPGGHPLDRARDLPRRRGDRADAGPRDVVRADARRARRASSTRPRPASSCRRRRGQGAERHRRPSSGVPARGRGRRADRDGHRQRRHPARPQPARARADGRAAG